MENGNPWRRKNKKMKGRTDWDHRDSTKRQRFEDPARRAVDAETMQYFMEISALIGESGSITDPEERATICENALEEAYGKELQLACDNSCSRILEMLLSFSDMLHVSTFLHQISFNFFAIASNPSGSHVLEVALETAKNSLHSYDTEAAWCKTLKMALSKICQVVGDRAAEIMLNSYGSHVLRSLLSFFFTTDLDVLPGNNNDKFYGAPARLTACSSKSDTTKILNSELHTEFEDIFERLVEMLLISVTQNTAKLQRDSHAGPVLQVILKSLKGGKSRILVKAIAVCIDSAVQNLDEEGNVFASTNPQNIMNLVFDKNGSHLIEVVLDVAPDSLYNELLDRFFRGRVLELSQHPSANYVVQALLASVRNQGQVKLILEELGTSFLTLIKARRSGVLVCLLSACGRLFVCEKEACHLLARAMDVRSCASPDLISRILYLESYAQSEDPTRWKPNLHQKMSILGCLMLQSIFSYTKESNHQFYASLAVMESSDVLEMVKSVCGCRVVEAFLLSDASLKLKQRLISKLKGHFAELSAAASGSFTIEKCFSVAKLDMKEAIVSELSSIHGDLSQTKHGPILLQTIDMAGFLRNPAKWRTRLSLKQEAMKDFSEIFTSESKEPFQSSKPHSNQSSVKANRGLDGDESGSRMKFNTTGNNLSQKISFNDAMALLGFHPSSSAHNQLPEKNKGEKVREEVDEHGASIASKISPLKNKNQDNDQDVDKPRKKSKGAVMDESCGISEGGIKKVDEARIQVQHNPAKMAMNRNNQRKKFNSNGSTELRVAGFGEFQKNRSQSVGHAMSLQHRIRNNSDLALRAGVEAIEQTLGLSELNSIGKRSRK